LVVDTLGLLIRAFVHPANQNDRDGAKPLLSGLRSRLPDLQVLWADQGYNGAPFASWLGNALPGCELRVTTRSTPHLWTNETQNSQPPTKPAFEFLPRRWVVERTFGWLLRNRRLSKDYEGLPKTEEALIYLAMVNLMLRRL
jgi:putative transposase